jgi:hypothetical protein
MTAKELIEKLQQVPGEMTVLVDCGDEADYEIGCAQIMYDVVYLSYEPLRYGKLL